MRITTIALLLSLTVSLLEAQEAKRPPATVAVTLSDGSVLVSTNADDAVEVRTPYGDQKIPLNQIVTARRQASGRFQITAKGLNTQGELLAREIRVHTAAGPVRVDADDLRSINLTSGAGAYLDDSTRALWWFGDTIDGSCRDRVKGRAFELHDFEMVEDVGIESRKPQSRGSVPSDPDLEIMDQDFTLDIRFRMPKKVRQYVMIVQKANPKDGNQDFNLFAAANGMLYVSSLRTGNSVQSPPNTLKKEGWNTVTIVQRTQPLSVTCYVNGRVAVTGNFALSQNDGRNRGLAIGNHPRFGGNFDSPEAIQYLRLSRGARGTEEIEELERGAEHRGPRVPGVPGIVLRDGSFLRGDMAALGTPVFRTRFGPLTLSEKTGGQVKLFRLRLSELEKEQASIKEVIARLGSTDGVDRERAGKALLAHGEAAIPVLKESLSSADPEIRNRIVELLKKLEETGAARRPACDVLHFGGVQVQGWMDIAPFELATRRGKVPVQVAQLAELHFGRKEARPRPLLRLFSGETLEFEPAEGAKVDVEGGFGRLSIPLEDLKTMAYDAQRKTWTLTTEAATVSGTLTGNVGLQTALGVLTLPWSESRDLRPVGAPADAPPAVVQPSNGDDDDDN